MNRYFLFLLILLMSIQTGCSLSPRRSVEGEFLIVSANLLYDNAEGEEISAALIDCAADILILVEAVPGKNVDQGMLEAAGYTCFLAQGSHPAFNVMLASRGECTFGSVLTDFSTTPDPSIDAPIGTCRVNRDGFNICIMGIHIPAPFHFSEKTRDLAFSTLEAMIESGRLGSDTGSGFKDDWVILGGDFNCFPSDKRMLALTEKGLTDSHEANPALYSYTWSPGGIPPLARIDYILATRWLSVADQTTFSLPGSDHEAVLAGIEL